MKSNFIEIPKSLLSKLQKYSKLDQYKNFDIPFLIIDKEGKESWTLYNIKLNIQHLKTFEYHEISDLMYDRIHGDKNLWNNIFYIVNPFKDSFNNPVYNIEELWTEKWNDWEIKNHGKLYFRGEFTLDIPKLFSISWIEINRKIKGFKFFKSENKISKVIAHYQESINLNRSLFDDDKGKETIFEEYNFTIFYIDQNGLVFLKDNQLEFDSDSCIPFLKIDKEGETSWQFYNHEKDLFFGRILTGHYEVEKELKSTLTSQSTYFWETYFTPKYSGHLIELNEWRGWTTNDVGDLYFDEKFKLNIFELNLDFPFVNGDPILRFLDSDNQISKLIAYCQDGDEDGRIDDWYQTIFYLNDKGRIFLENNFLPQREFDKLDA
jgi:hypothetical protein